MILSEVKLKRNEDDYKNKIKAVSELPKKIFYPEDRQLEEKN